MKNKELYKSTLKILLKFVAFSEYTMFNLNCQPFLYKDLIVKQFTLVRNKEVHTSEMVEPEEGGWEHAPLQILEDKLTLSQPR